MSRLVIVFSGFNQRAVIAFLRTLETNNVSYAIVANSQDDPIFLTSYKDKVTTTRSKKILDLKDILKSISLIKRTFTHQSYLIAPSTEALNRFLLQNRDTFEENNCEVPLVAEGLYEKISNKYQFGYLCKKAGISVPFEYIIPQSKQLPLVAKPRQYSNTKGDIYSPILINTEKELCDFKNTYDAADFYFQEFVSGESLYLLYYFYKNGNITKYSQKNYVQQPGGKSIVAAESTDLHLLSESKKYENLFVDMGFRGLVMVEVKRNEKGCYMIEANPRFWGPSQLFVDAEQNFFEDFLYDWGVIKTKSAHKRPSEITKYFWYGGFQDSEIDNMTYHSYDSKQFRDNLPEWFSSDVYNREDTKELFKLEAKGKV